MRGFSEIARGYIRRLALEPYLGYRHAAERWPDERPADLL